MKAPQYYVKLTLSLLLNTIRKFVMLVSAPLPSCYMLCSESVTRITTNSDNVQLSGTSHEVI
jgi:hypothetical protein